MRKYNEYDADKIHNKAECTLDELSRSIHQASRIRSQLFKRFLMWLTIFFLVSTPLIFKIRHDFFYTAYTDENTWRTEDSLWVAASGIFFYKVMVNLLSCQDISTTIRKANRKHVALHQKLYCIKGGMYNHVG
jgi:hypothetical protein